MHAAGFFRFGFNGGFSVENASGLFLVSFGREVADAKRAANIAIPDASEWSKFMYAMDHFNGGDYRLGVAAGLLGGDASRGGVSSSAWKKELCN